MEDDKVYMVVAMRRNGKAKGENQGLSKKVLRRVVRPGEEYQDTANEFKEMLSNEPGYWRMYRSVNRRSLTKAKQALQIKLITDGDRIAHKIDSEWKSLLMKKEQRAERLYLLDIDTKDEKTVIAIINKVDSLGVALIEQIETPNGHHIVIEPLDKRELSEFEDVSVKTDDLVYLFDFGDDSYKS